MLPQVAIVICYGVPSYREAAWRDGWWDNPRSHIAVAQHPKPCQSCSCQSVVPVRWEDAQQGISGALSPGVAVVWSLSTIISHNGPTPA